MEVKNRLKGILQESGIKSMVPTSKLLTDSLGGMSLIRFNKLLNNASPKPITVQEVQLLADWLGNLTGQPASTFEIVQTDKKEAATC